MNIPLIDLKAQFRTIEPAIRSAFDRLCDSQGWILGKTVEDFEAAVAEYHGVKHAVGCASGTDALLLAMMAMKIGGGDEVITTPHTFVATGMAVVRAGARPVFVDVESGTLNIDPEKIEAAITPRTRAILPVHLYGQPADLHPILEIADRRGIPVIEDCAQAIGATYRGRKVGTLGRIGCFSCYPGKNLGAYGDAGFVVTDDDALAEEIRIRRVHGSADKHFHTVIGLNSRPDAFQAAVLSAKLPHIDGWNETRRSAADRYGRLLARHAGEDPRLVLPSTAPDRTHVWHLYVLRHPERDRIQEGLRDVGISTQAYYPVPLHRQPCFENLDVASGNFPVAEAAAADNFAIPLYPEITEGNQDYVALHLGRILAGLPARRGASAP